MPRLTSAPKPLCLRPSTALFSNDMPSQPMMISPKSSAPKSRAITASSQGKAVKTPRLSPPGPFHSRLSAALSHRREVGSPSIIPFRRPSTSKPGCNSTSSQRRNAVPCSAAATSSARPSLIIPIPSPQPRRIRSSFRGRRTWCAPTSYAPPPEHSARLASSTLRRKMHRTAASFRKRSRIKRLT